ncbi:uncharacterized protein LOC112081558 [Eutrema salsugineum]|uniref:uncharacterized protein LOC112081558 n=1 Tax=Eutrema salsugineum TaxID=72664 RepID=UPI000CED6E19|nr:uncharacterized protein LOC112081558 [Eutrema salsugineum]
MTSNKAFSFELNKNIGGKVKFGNGSCLRIVGKGSMLFQSKTIEQKIVSDIYYIPELKGNILFLGQATEAGCDVRMRQDYLTLHDPSGRLLVKTRQSFLKASMFRASRPLELLHADLCGPISPPTIAEKSEAFERFKAFKELVEKELGRAILTLRTNRGGELTSREFYEFCESKGIKRHLTAPYTSQQNGVVERRNRTLMEMTRSSLKAMNVEAVNLKKLDDKSHMLVHLEIEPESKAYRLYNPETRRITVSCDVVFDEKASWNWNKPRDGSGRDPGMFQMR